jgi:Arc/MetJ-type ribon-helix-helix transcriptional regulator
MATKTTNMNISLPVWMKTWIEQTSTERGFCNISEFVRHAMREAWLDQQHQADEEQAVLDGFNSPMSEMTSSDWDELKRPFLERMQAEKKAA